MVRSRAPELAQTSGLPGQAKNFGPLATIFVVGSVNDTGAAPVGFRRHISDGITRLRQASEGAEDRSCRRARGASAFAGSFVFLVVQT
jgi:hypothetical protein